MPDWEILPRHWGGGFIAWAALILAVINTGRIVQLHYLEHRRAERSERQAAEFVALSHERVDRMAEAILQPPRRRPLLVAGSHQQAIDWLQEHGLSRSDVVVAQSPEALRGLLGASVDLELIGTWRQRTDLLELALALEAAGVQGASRLKT